MSYTKAQQLEAVENAIYAIMNGGAAQAYAINGRRLDRMPLPDLMRWRDQLKNEIANASGEKTAYATFEDPE